MLRCDNLWWIWSSFLSINFTLLILSWFLTSFFSRGTRSRFSTLAMNFVVMAYLSDKVRPILRLKLSCLSNKKKRASLDWIWIFGILILSDLGKLHCAKKRPAHSIAKTGPTNSILFMPFMFQYFAVWSLEKWQLLSEIPLFPCVRASIRLSVGHILLFYFSYQVILSQLSHFDSN